MNKCGSCHSPCNMFFLLGSVGPTGFSRVLIHRLSDYRLDRRPPKMALTYERSAIFRNVFATDEDPTHKGNMGLAVLRLRVAFRWTRPLVPCTFAIMR